MRALPRWADYSISAAVSPNASLLRGAARTGDSPVRHGPDLGTGDAQPESL